MFIYGVHMGIYQNESRDGVAVKCRIQQRRGNDHGCYLGLRREEETDRERDREREIEREREWGEEEERESGVWGWRKKEDK